MREFTTDHAVSAMSSYSSSLSSLWGLFIVATFAAAGFGASMGEDFTLWVAMPIGIGFLAFTAAHLSALVVLLKKHKIVADEIGARFRADPEGFTDYPRSLAAVLESTLSLRATILIHLTIDASVIAVTAARVL